MQIKKLTVSNIFCFAAEQELVFDAPVYQVVGERIGIENHSNGTGKSSLYYIIQEILFGKNIKKTLKEYTGNVFTDPTNYSAGLDFDHAGHSYNVTLGRRNKKASLMVMEDNEDISKHTVPETYKMLVEILGIDYELFTMLTYLSPTISTPNTIFFGTPKEKKELFTKLFNLQEVVKKVDKAASVGRELTVDLKASERQVQGMKDIIIPTLPQMPDFEGLERLRVSKGEQLSLAGQLKVMIEGHNSWLGLLAEKEQTEIKLSNSKDVKHNPEKLDYWRGELAEAKVELKSFSTRVKELKNVDALCPTCGAELQDEKALAEWLLAAQLGVNEWTAIVKDCEDHIFAEATIKAEEEFRTKLKIQLDQINSRLSDFDNSVKSIDEAKEKHKVTLGKLADINESIALLEKQISVYRQIEGKIDTLKQLKRDQAIEKEELLQKIATLSEEIKLYKTIGDYLGLTGFLSTKIIGMAEHLTELINDYLLVFSNNSLFIRFSGTDKLTFKLLKDHKELPINNLSAGQLTMIQLSSILALRALIQLNKGITIDLLVLDELFGTLDSVRREILTDTLREISLAGEHKVLSISHLTNDPSLPTITIRQEGGISEICQ